MNQQNLSDTLVLFNRLFVPVSKRKTEERSGVTFGNDSDRKYCCIYCNTVITDELLSVEIAGSHRHFKTNPKGNQFSIRCFHAAPGCLGSGLVTAEFTWFTGYRWQIAICASCGEQLGWRFEGDSSFYCLIADCLRECGDEKGGL